MTLLVQIQNAVRTLDERRQRQVLAFVRSLRRDEPDVSPLQTARDGQPVVGTGRADDVASKRAIHPDHAAVEQRVRAFVEEFSAADPEVSAVDDLLTSRR